MKPFPWHLFEPGGEEAMMDERIIDVGKYCTKCGEPQPCANGHHPLWNQGEDLQERVRYDAETGQWKIRLEPTPPRSA